MKEHEHSEHEHGESCGLGHGSPNKLRTAIGRNLLIAVFITALIFLVELAGGFLTNSLALISDAGHMFVDVASLLLSMFAIWFAQRPADKKRTFGMYRIEILAALFNGISLGLLSFFIFYEGYQRFFAPEAVKSVPMIIIAFVGLVANIVSGLILHNDSKHNINVRGAFLHVLGDALSSVGVIVAGAVIYFTGWSKIDPLISIAIAVIILKGAWGLIKESLDVLLEAVPDKVDLEGVIKEIELITQAEKVHHVHFWTISSNVYALSGHIKVGDMPVSRTEKLTEEVRERLRNKFSIEHVTLQYECNECSEDTGADGVDGQ
ncbi:MAG: cation diffusion facilitator family transporter, partial [Candidatus Firestonebacteria bacterium]